MRLPVRRIWRAFPELDIYSDDECRLFMRQARPRLLIKVLQALLLLSIIIGGIAAGLAVITVIAATAIGPLTARLGPRAELVVLPLLPLLLGPPPVMALLVRDWLLGRRLRYVLRDQGSCPRCRYSLVGLAIPQSLEVACPECGFACKVDQSLSVLTRADGRAVIGEGVRVAMHRVPYWTAERMRRWMRRSVVVLALLAVTIGVPAAIYEWSVRAAVATARREKPTASDLTAILERSRPGVPRTDDPRALAILRSVGQRIDEIEVKVSPRPQRPGNQWVAFEWLFREPEVMGKDERMLEDERASREIALRMFEALEAEGVGNDLAALRGVPQELRDTQQAPEEYFGTVLPHLGVARRASGYMAARMLAAIHRGDIDQASESLETMLAIAQACHGQPFIIEVLVGWAIEGMAHDRARQWLLSEPTPEVIDAIERALLREDDPVVAAQLGIECEALIQKALIASVLSDPSLVRLGRWGNIATRLPGFFNVPPIPPGSWARNRDVIDAAARAWVAEITVEPHAIMASSRPAFPSFDGAGLAQLLWPALGRLAESHHLRRLWQRALRTMIALERWRLEHGAYPTELQQLVPSRLHELPVDPWTGKVFGYRRIERAGDPLDRGYLLYVFGSDGIDDGGREPVLDPLPANRALASWRWLPSYAPSGTDVQLNWFEPIRQPPSSEPTPRATPSSGVDTLQSSP